MTSWEKIKVGDKLVLKDTSHSCSLDVPDEYKDWPVEVVRNDKYGLVVLFEDGCTEGFDEEVWNEMAEGGYIVRTN